MAGRQSTPANSAPGTRILIVSALPNAVKSPGQRATGYSILRMQYLLDLSGGTRKRAPYARVPLRNVQFLRSTRIAKTDGRSVLWWWRRRLHTLPSVPVMPEFPALHLREGWIRCEKRGGGRLSDIGQLIGRRPKARIGVRFLQQ